MASKSQDVLEKWKSRWASNTITRDGAGYRIIESTSNRGWIRVGLVVMRFVPSRQRAAKESEKVNIGSLESVGGARQECCAVLLLVRILGL